MAAYCNYICLKKNEILDLRFKLYGEDPEDEEEIYDDFLQMKMMTKRKFKDENNEETTEANKKAYKRAIQIPRKKPYELLQYTS